MLSQERVKLWTSNFVETFTGSIGTKAHEFNVGHSIRGRSQSAPKFVMAPMYRRICAVIFAIAQLSCNHGKRHVCEWKICKNLASTALVNISHDMW